MKNNERRTFEDDEIRERVTKLLKEGQKMLAEHCPKCGSPLFFIKERGLKYCPKCQVYLASEAEIKTADVDEESRIYDFNEYWKETEGDRKEKTKPSPKPDKEYVKKSQHVRSTIQQKKAQGTEDRDRTKEKIDETIQMMLAKITSKIKNRDVSSEKLIEWLEKLIRIRKELTREQFES